MGLVEIDVIGLQPPKRILNRLLHILRGQTRLTTAHIHPDFGGDDDLIPFAGPGKPFADDGFGFAACIPRHPCGINIGRIDEG